MIACLDVHYEEKICRAAAVVSEHWTATAPIDSYATTVEVSGPYQAGQFYLRELAPLLAVVKQITRPIDVFVLDAYCYLDDDGSPGLGAYFHQAIGSRAVVIGVAKNRFRDSSHAEELFRGGSSRPLMVTSIGIGSRQAAEKIASMAGKHRLPTMIKAADRLARDGQGDT